MNLNHEKELHLEPWMEVIGELHGISRDDHYLYVEIGKKILAFRKESDESLFIQDKLNDGFIGRSVAILRTDIPEKPILLHLASKRS